jgi:PAS domain S-box-containing protein
MLDAILESTSDQVFVLDRAGHFLDLSGAAAATFGYERKALVGKTGADLGLPTEVLEQARTELAAVIATGMSHSAEISYPSPNGVRHSSYTWVPLPDDHGVVEAILLTGRDITEYRRAEKALSDRESKYRAIVDTASEGIWTVDADFCTTYVNRQMADMLGYNSQEMLGCSVLDFLFPEDRAGMEQRFAERKRGRNGQYDARYRRKDGSELWALSMTAPQHDEQGRFMGAIGMFSDITQRVQTERERAEHLREIETLNRRLQRGIGETHHRVKNNLQVMMALLNMETMRHEETIPTEHIRQIAQHVHALAVIHDLLTHQAKTDALAQELPVKVMMAKLLPTLQGMVAGRTLRYRVDDVRLTIRQSSALAMLLNELISNAIKHGAGDITIRFAVAEGRASLEIMDEGPGFPEDFNPGDPAYTGIELIQSLARWDLSGDIDFERHEDGALVRVEFPVNSGDMGR